MTHIENLAKYERQLENENLTEKQLEKVEAKIERALNRISKSEKLQEQYEAYYGLEWDC